MGHSSIVLTAKMAVDTVAGSYVLHVVPANGGGVDRYVRDICAHRLRDRVLHVVHEQCVFEAVAARRFIPIDHERMADSSVLGALGRPMLLHAHSTLAPVRDQVALLSKTLGVDYAVTLHDIDFAGRFDVVNDDERELRLNFVRSAALRIVPSAFISTLLSTAVGGESTRELIENGVDISVTRGESDVAFSTPGQFQIAVVGALGPHKGLKFLLEVVAALPPEVCVVIIGYVDGQITPGWLQTDRLWVHGVFEPRDLASVIRRYGSRLALFPNRQPESFSYALSDVWCGGLPALGPGTGAIGERILKSSAGWIYDADSSAEAVAARLIECLTGTDLVATHVYEASTTLQSTNDMVDHINRQYEKIMRTPHQLYTESEIEPQLQTLETLAATHLNGHFFRAELQKLSGDIAFNDGQMASANEALKTLKNEFDARGEWIDALEKNLVECRAELLRIEDARKREHAEAVTAIRLAHSDAERAARQAHEDQTLYAAKLQKDVNDTLAIAHQQARTLAIYEYGLSMIPPLIRRKMLARAERLAALKVTQ